MNVCISVGHSHPRVVAAAMEQAQNLTHCTTMFYHPTLSHLAEELAAKMPKGNEWVAHLTNSGSEAIDLAMTMARTYTGNVAFVPEPNQYRGIFGPTTQPYLDEIDRTIATATSGKVAGIFVERVQGYGGIIEMPPGYMSGAAKRVRADGGLYIADEVQSGFGRTGTHFWGFEADNVVPDIVVMAKELGNGFQIGAVVARKEVAAPMSEKFMFHTYGANPTSAAAARAVLAVIKDERLQQNAQTVGAALLERLRVLQTRPTRSGMFAERV